MIKAVLNDMHELELPEKLEIRMNSKSPVFFPEIGDFSFPFQISGHSRINSLAFNFPSRPNQFSNIQVSNDIKIYNNNQLILSGELVTKETKSGNLSNYIKSQNGLFYSLIKNKKMTEVEMGGERVLGVDVSEVYAYYDSIAATKYPYADFAVFPVCNTNFYDGFISIETVWKNNNNVVNWYHQNQFKDIRASTPFPYLCYFLKQLFTMFGYSIRENFFETDDELKSICIYNANAASTWYVMPGGGINLRAALVIDLAKHLPEINISTFLIDIQRRFNCSIHIDDYLKEVRIIKNQDLLQLYNETNLTKLLDNQISWQHERPTGFLLNSNNDSTDKQIIINTLNLDNIKDSVATETDLPLYSNTINDLRLVTDQQTYYIWSFPNDGTLNPPEWVPYANFWPIAIGYGKNEILSNVDTLKMHKGEKLHFIDRVTKWLVPRSDQLGNIVDSYQWTGHEFSARLLFYRGMYNDEIGNPYPLASSDVYDYDNNIIGNYSLRWNSAYGIYEKFYKNWLWHRMNIGKFGKTNVNINSSDIANIKNFKKYKIQNFSVLPVRKDYTIFNNGQAFLDIEFYKL